MPTKEDIMKALKEVVDPEINIDIVTLELILDVKIENESVKIKMTLTTPMCPYGPMLVEEVKEKVKDLGFKEVDVGLSFDPPWEPSAELRAVLGV